MNLLPPFVSPAACFGSGTQLMDSSERQPLKWHYFRSVDKLGNSYLVLPHGRCSRSESHLSLSISAALGRADQTSRVEPSLTTAHDRYVTTWKWSCTHSNHTELKLMLNAHHLEAWRGERDRTGTGHCMMISYHGWVITLRWYETLQCEQVTMDLVDRRWCNMHTGIDLLSDSILWQM